MGYVPNDVKWFIAEIVEEITVKDDPRNVVHVNHNLIRADSPEEAYNKALELGRSGETQYENSKGKQVSVRFRRLRNLLVVYDELEHGAELMFEESIGMSSLDLQKMLKPKEEIEAFIPWQPSDFSKQPDYGSKEIIEEVERRFDTKRFGGIDK